MTALWSVIPGGVTETQFKALLIASIGVPPRAFLTRSNGQSQREAVVPAPRSADVDRQLSARGVEVYRVFASGLVPGERYTFSVEVDGSIVHELALRTLPPRLPAEGITIAVGSCYYDGFHKDVHLAAALRAMRLVEPVSWQFWIGDNVYLDVPAFSPGVEPYPQTVGRYLDYFMRSEYWRARALTPNYTTYDDHDFWNNYPEHVLWLSRDDDDQRAGYIEAAQNCLELFQSSLNPPPSSGADGNSFQLDIPPLSIFVADTRARRELCNAGKGRMLTKADLAALRNWAGRLRGPGVLMLGQPLWIARGSATADYNPPDFIDYPLIWQALCDADYDVLVVSGDVHHSRVLKLTARGRSIYEFVTSPACCIPTSLSQVIEQGRTQGRGTIDPPGRDPGSGQNATAQYYFGTRAANTIGLLHFAPAARNNVRVSAGFIDYTAAPVWAEAHPCSTQLPTQGAAVATCRREGLFDLRARDEYV